MSAQADPWGALSTFLERSLELQSRDRGLREVLLTDPEGRERIAAMRDRLHPAVERLVARAQESGDLRPGFGHTDLAIAMTMAGSVMDYTHEVDPGAWRRALAIVLEGLGGDAPLPGAPLTPEQLDAQTRRRAR